jgi:hypothetical protein
MKYDLRPGCLGHAPLNRHHAVGVETYANSRRLEKSLRLQNADL